MTLIKKASHCCKKLVFHPYLVIRTAITFLYCTTGVLANFFLLQVFCMPVWWASVICLLFFTALLLYPFITSATVRNLSSLLIGMGVPVCIYCIVFLWDPWGSPFSYLGYLLAVIFFGLGLLAFIPVYLLWHVCNYYKISSKINRRFILTGVFMPLICLSIYLVLFKKNFDVIRTAYKVDKRQVNFLAHIPKNYFSERILGIGFKYHTKLEFIHDGWRPPLHDPFLNIGLWCFSDTYNPFHLKGRIGYYHLLFPNEPIKIDCPCSYMKDGASYLSEDWDKYLP